MLRCTFLLNRQAQSKVPRSSKERAIVAYQGDSDTGLVAQLSYYVNNNYYKIKYHIDYFVLGCLKLFIVFMAV